MGNLARHICDFSCSKHQSNFMHIAETRVDNITKSKFQLRVFILIILIENTQNYRGICARVGHLYHRKIHKWNFQQL